MNRRTFVRGSAGLTAGLALTGCLGVLGGNSSPPPRKAELFDDVALDGTTMEIDLLSDPRVQSRAEEAQNGLAAGAVASLAPVGVARAAKGAGGRGAGGYAGAPRHHRHRGWAVWHGGDYADDWRENHRDELSWYPATVATLGVAYLGTDNEYEDNPPGPGADDVSWDRTWNQVSDDAVKTVDIGAVSPSPEPEQGWYRVGTELVAENRDLDFGWQAVDFEVDDDTGWKVDKAWYVAPRV
ncbi:MAG: twin-arginine translocation signal domain-containing protein [Haloarculaceae archaeon]